MNLTSEEVQGLDSDIDVIRDTEDPDRFCFVVKAGPYKGIAYSYIGVDLQPVEEADGVKIPEGQRPVEVVFNYVILENPGEPEDEAFHDKIGNLLVKMIEKLAEKGSS